MGRPHVGRVPARLPERGPDSPHSHLVSHQPVPGHGGRGLRGGVARGRRPARPRHRTGRRRVVPAAQLDRSGGHLLRLRHARRDVGADRALLRAQGGRLHPAPEPRPRLRHRVAHQPARLPGRAGDDPRRPERSRGRDRGGGHRRPEPPPLRRPALGRSDRGTGARRSRHAGADRLHLGHHRRPQGRRAHPSDVGLRGAPARRQPGQPRPAGTRRCARGPRHRHARRSAVPARRRQAHLHDRRVGPADRVGRHARRADLRRQRVDLLLHQPARPPRLRARAHRADALHRPGRIAHSRRRGRASGQAGHLPGAVLRLHRAPLDHRVPARGTAREAHPHRRLPHALGRGAHGGRGRQGSRRRRGRRNPQPRPRPLRRATPTPR